MTAAAPALDCELPDHDIQHHAPWSCVVTDCTENGTGGAIAAARHHHEHHDTAPTPTGEPQ